MGLLFLIRLKDKFFTNDKRLSESVSRNVENENLKKDFNKEETFDETNLMKGLFDLQYPKSFKLGINSKNQSLSKNEKTMGAKVDYKLVDEEHSNPFAKQKDENKMKFRPRRQVYLQYMINLFEKIFEMQKNVTFDLIGTSYRNLLKQSYEIFKREKELDLKNAFEDLNNSNQKHSFNVNLFGDLLNSYIKELYKIDVF